MKLDGRFGGAEQRPRKDRKTSNWRGNGWVLSKRDGNDTIVAFAYTAWEDTDVTNYLAGGHWAKVNADDEVTELGTFGDAGPGSVFSYYDGQDSSWEKPITRTATYLGEAEGAYVDPDGDGGVYTYTTIEDLKADRWTEEDLYVALRGGRIDNDGSFEGTLKVLELSTDNELTSQGKWGGLFSENSNTSANPSQAFGTLGGTAEGIGFIGVFHGQRQRSVATRLSGCTETVFA